MEQINQGAFFLSIAYTGAGVLIYEISRRRNEKKIKRIARTHNAAMDKKEKE